MATTIPRVVLDTHVVMDLWLFADPAVGHIRAQISSGSIRWLVCPKMRIELLHVLGRDWVRTRFASIDPVLTAWADWSHPCDDPPTTPQPGWTCRDRSDQVFIDLAVLQGATALLTNDRAILALRKKATARGLEIVQPRSWHRQP